MNPNDWRRMTARLTEDEASAQERLKLALEVNSGPASGPELDPVECRKLLEAEHGQVWDSYQLARDFEVEAFSPPLVVVVRRSDGARGSVVYQHEPRFYWGFQPA